MGACWKVGMYSDTDWKAGIRKIQEEANEEYGHQGGYSGMPNSCTYTYMGDYSKSTPEKVKEFMEQQSGKLPNGSGGIIKIGVAGQLITRAEPFESFSSSYLQFLKLMNKGPAMAIVISISGNVNIIKEGTIGELKKYVTQKLKQYIEQGSEIVIISKNTPKVQGWYTKSRMMNTTSAQSSSTTKVETVYKYGYFGWCRE